MAQPMVKAELLNLDNKGDSFTFMFNPTQLKLQEAVQTAESPGARTDGGPNEGGFPKVSFSYTKARIVTISDIHFDTYEAKDKNVRTILAPLLNAVRFVAGKQRPPIYTFLWGKEIYIRLCFVQQIDYTLTMFLPDGTPVRAVINTLSLKEADLPDPNNPQSTQVIDDYIREEDRKRMEEAKKAAQQRDPGTIGQDNQIQTANQQGQGNSPPSRGQTANQQGPRNGQRPPRRRR